MKSYIYCFIAIFFFSTMEFVGKFIAEDMSAYAITAYRFLLGGVFLLFLQ
jgi:drug/metabolite transporter (DMT)-like permease